MLAQRPVVPAVHSSRRSLVTFQSRSQLARMPLYGQRRTATTTVRAAFTSENPVRQAISQVAINIYKASAMFSPQEPGLSPLWSGLRRLDLAAVSAALRAGADPNEREPAAGAGGGGGGGGDTPLLLIARMGHYKYPPNEIPAALIRAGADLEVQDGRGLTALQVSLLSGWQNIAELLLRSGASTAGVAAIKPRITCPDCKRLVAKYDL